MFNRNKKTKPEKPNTLKQQVSMMWDVLFNEIPHHFKWQDRKINFVLIFMGLILAAVGIGIAILFGFLAL